MKTEEFAKWAREDSQPLRVDGITISTPQGTFVGHGMLWVENEKFVLRVTLDGSNQLPPVRGTYTREQFWKIQGRIEDKLPFFAEGLSGQRTSHWGHYTAEQATFNLDRLSFVTEQTQVQELDIAAALVCRSHIVTCCERRSAMTALAR